MPLIPTKWWCGIMLASAAQVKRQHSTAQRSTAHHSAAQRSGLTSGQLCPPLNSQGGSWPSSAAEREMRGQGTRTASFPDDTTPNSAPTETTPFHVLLFCRRSGACQNRPNKPNTHPGSRPQSWTCTSGAPGFRPDRITTAPPRWTCGAEQVRPGTVAGLAALHGLYQCRSRARSCIRGPFHPSNPRFLQLASWIHMSSYK